MKAEKFANLVNKAKNNYENKQICKENLFYG